MWPDGTYVVWLSTKTWVKEVLFSNLCVCVVVVFDYYILSKLFAPPLLAAILFPWNLLCFKIRRIVNFNVINLFNYLNVIMKIYQDSEIYDQTFSFDLMWLNLTHSWSFFIVIDFILFENFLTRRKFLS